MNIEAILNNLNEERTKVAAELSKLDEQRGKITSELRRIHSAIKALSGTANAPRPMSEEHKRKISAALKAKAAQKKQASAPAPLDFKSAAANDKTTAPAPTNPAARK